VVSLAKLVRTMNCYYSNLIEGHATHPVDIERALQNDYSREPKKRDLQLEAKAHIVVQEWIDNSGVKGRVFDVESIRDVHRRFCEQLPADLLVVEDPITKRNSQGGPRRTAHALRQGRPARRH
jgi:Fic family protein